MFGMFPFMFNSGFNDNWNNINTLRNLLNDDFLNSMVNQILSSGLRNNLIGTLEKEDNYNLGIEDYGNYYLIKGYLPGVGSKDISIDFERNRAILKVRRKRTYSNGRNFSMTIMGPGQDFIKSFYIDEIDSSKVKASFNNNLLMITLPKVNNVGNDYGCSSDDEPIIIDVDSYKVE